jgi:Leucine-rich repeat (LRR) protein
MTDYSVTTLDLSKQHLTELPKDIHLYTKLKKLYVSFNYLTELPNNLPPSLIEIRCYNNNLESLPDTLPDSLEILSFDNIDIHDDYDVDDFGITIAESYRDYLENRNIITSLPNLPKTLKTLSCIYTDLKDLPEILPPLLETLDCSGNELYKLPDIPHSLKILHCSNNQLMCLPDLPDTIEILYCEDNPFCDELDFVVNEKTYPEYLKIRENAIICK